MVQTFNMDEYLIYVRDLPNKITAGSKELNYDLAKNLQQRIITRAPSGSTGSLKNIKIRKDKDNFVLEGPAHWFFVNAGMAPNKMIPIEFFEMHQTNPGSTAGKKLFIPDPKAFVMANYKGGKGFVDNAIASFDKNMNQIINNKLPKLFRK